MVYFSSKQMTFQSHTMALHAERGYLASVSIASDTFEKCELPILKERCNSA
jgi:hypothetical protein